MIKIILITAKYILESGNIKLDGYYFNCLKPYHFKCFIKIRNSAIMSKFKGYLKYDLYYIVL